VDDHHVVDWHTKPIGDDLRERRLLTLPVG